MNFLGGTKDNIHVNDTFIKNGSLSVDGDVFVGGDLEVDGDIIGPIAQARVQVNKYAGNTTNIRDQTENGVYLDIEASGFGDKVYTDEEFSEGSVINIEANGNWSYLRSSQAFIPEGRFRIVFGSVIVELFAPFPEGAFAGTYPDTKNNNGNWNLKVTLTRTSPTAFRIGGVLTNSLAELQNQVEISIIKPEQLDLLPNILSVPTFPANLNIQWQDNSNQGGGNAYLYPALCRYNQDLVNAGSTILGSSENLTTDHLLLSNLNSVGPSGFADAGHNLMFLSNASKPINGSYFLPSVDGNPNDVLITDGAGNTSFSPLAAGTARVWINKYAINTAPTFGTSLVAVNLDSSGFGSKSYSADEFPIGAQIRVQASGTWNINTSGSPPAGAAGQFVVSFGPGNPIGTFITDSISIVKNNGSYNEVNTGVGWWSCNFILTRTSSTLCRIGRCANNSIFQAGGLTDEVPIVCFDPNGQNGGPFNVPNFPFVLDIQFIDQSGPTNQCFPIAAVYNQDLMVPTTSILATSENLTTDHTLLSNLTIGDAGHTQFALLAGRNGGQILSGGITPLHNLKLKSHTAGLDNVTVKDLNTQFNKNIDMDNNSIINLQNIDVGGGTLNISNTGFPAMNITGGVNFNNTGFIYQCPSLFAGSGNLDIGSDFGVVNIQTGPFGSRQTEIAIIPNLINVNSPITNFVGGDVFLSQNRIQDVKAIDDGANNSITMKDAGLGNAININSVGAGVNLQEQSTGNRIDVTTTGLASQVLSGGTIIQNSDAGNNLTLSKTNGGQIILQNTGVGGVITGEAEQIDFNYTTNNFKVRNGLTNNFVIEPTQVKSFLNFVCPSINGLTASSGVFMGTSDSLFYNPSVDGAIEKSILPTSIAGSFTVPANTFQISSYHLVLAGPFNSNNGDTLTIRLYGGPTSTTILGVLVVPLNNSSTHFEIECDFQIRAIGGPGVAQINTNFDFTYNQSGGGGAFVGERNTGTNNITFDTTVNNTLLVTAQFSSTNAANNMLTTLSKLTQTY